MKEYALDDKALTNQQNYGMNYSRWSYERMVVSVIKSSLFIQKVFNELQYYIKEFQTLFLNYSEPLRVMNVKWNILCFVNLDTSLTCRKIVLEVHSCLA